MWWCDGLTVWRESRLLPYPPTFHFAPLSSPLLFSPPPLPSPLLLLPSPLLYSTLPRPTLRHVLTVHNNNHNNNSNNKISALPPCPALSIYPYPSTHLPLYPPLPYIPLLGSQRSQKYILHQVILYLYSTLLKTALRLWAHILYSYYNTTNLSCAGCWLLAAGCWLWLCGAENDMIWSDVMRYDALSPSHSLSPTTIITSHHITSHHTPHVTRHTLARSKYK